MTNNFYIQWHITNICNLRCRHCYQDNFSKGSELTFADLETVLENIISTLDEWRKKLLINITGGEPLLKKELFQLLEVLESNNRIIELGLITNGILLTPSLIEKLSTFKKLKSLKISIDGAEEKINDDIRGSETFRKIIKSINIVKDNSDLDVVLMFTLMKRNFREIPQLIELAESLNINGVILERFIPMGTGLKIKNEVLSKTEWEELLGILSSIFSIKKITELIPYQGFYLIFDSQGYELLGAPCVIGRDSVCIMPDGSVLPCRRFPIPMGNLLNKTLGEIWENSELIKKLTDKNAVKGKCRNCLIVNCTGCRSLAYAVTGDYLAEDPNCPL